jgi:hypothetical protein
MAWFNAFLNGRARVIMASELTPALSSSRTVLRRGRPAQVGCH